MAAKVEARAVSKRFGPHVALEDFSIEIAPGETFGLIGPNGAGKTTFLRILTGFWLPTAGDVHVDGISVVEHPTAVQERLGYACEQPKLYMDHTVVSFLRLMGALRGLAADALEEGVERSIERFELHEVQGRRIGVLSKGFQQRVSLAQALLHNPTLLVVDEPTVGLDPRQQLELRRILRSIGRQHTLVLCTHQLREAEALCDRVALLDRGRLLRTFSSDELQATGSLEDLFLAQTRRKGEDA